MWEHRRVYDKWTKCSVRKKRWKEEEKSKQCMSGELFLSFLVLVVIESETETERGREQWLMRRSET